MNVVHNTETLKPMRVLLYFLQN